MFSGQPLVSTPGIGATFAIWATAISSGIASPDTLLDELAEHSVNQQFSFENGNPATLVDFLKNNTDKEIKNTYTYRAPGPGDAQGLPPGNPGTTAAFRSGEAIIINSAIALIPTQTPDYIQWVSYAVNFNNHTDPRSLREVEYDLSQLTRRTTTIAEESNNFSQFANRDLPAIISVQLAELQPIRTPPEVDQRVNKVLASIAQLELITSVAQQVSLPQRNSSIAAETFDTALRDLITAIRNAKVIAVNTAIEQLRT